MRYFDEHNLVKTDDYIEPVSPETIKFIGEAMANYDSGNITIEPRARVTLQRDMVLKESED